MVQQFTYVQEQRKWLLSSLRKIWVFLEIGIENVEIKFIF